MGPHKKVLGPYKWLNIYGKLGWNNPYISGALTLLLGGDVPGPLSLSQSAFWGEATWGHQSSLLLNPAPESSHSQASLSFCSAKECFKKATSRALFCFQAWKEVATLKVEVLKWATKTTQPWGSGSNLVLSKYICEGSFLGSCWGSLQQPLPNRRYLKFYWTRSKNHPKSTYTKNLTRESKLWFVLVHFETLLWKTCWTHSPSMEGSFMILRAAPCDTPGFDEWLYQYIHSLKLTACTWK